MKTHLLITSLLFFALFTGACGDLRACNSCDWAYDPHNPFKHNLAFCAFSSNITPTHSSFLAAFCWLSTHSSQMAQLSHLLSHSVAPLVWKTKSPTVAISDSTAYSSHNIASKEEAGSLPVGTHYVSMRLNPLNLHCSSPLRSHSPPTCFLYFLDYLCNIAVCDSKLLLSSFFSVLRRSRWETTRLPMARILHLPF